VGLSLLVEAGVAIVLHSERRELLFIVRAEREGDPWSGDVAFPGGVRQAGDQSTMTSAIREAREEVGLSLEPPQHRGSLAPLWAPWHHRPLPLRIVPHVFGVDGDYPQLMLGPEVAAAHWLPLDHFEAPPEQLERRVLSLPLRFRCYRIRGLTIWGLTLSMTYALLRSRLI
jgi:8-oxo-dGTP pyrophosphatase MutT (NUDIX family)